jgi:hypothetical protein
MAHAGLAQKSLRENYFLQMEFRNPEAIRPRHFRCARK